ncbi:uncharacterized protein Z518_08119 [Rhinocladiella mackenziei CBS 650.93]|uniref:Ergosterol biosynthesis protein Erg28 n=1 Tax=Rhinocladiella mackenziei CBS 650.93 TaxID=1442369 RepID=A0A0D2IZX0_9EURO|nr:uncharacterized protein Z518_08119 [Rhinocladiella mackenziei CBS 650.93]KIX02180.1 hypothetical protein Z518_08119 [Rhinocladiella mackenziei CBS 650.93]
MTSILPQSEGFLPLYILFVAVTSIGNAVQSYITLSYTRRLYPGQPMSAAKDKKSPADSSPVTPLSSRIFGTWTLAVGIVRIFAAYHIKEASWYQMQMLTNVVGLVHFGLEAFVYQTSQPSGPWLAPVSVATIGLVWSIVQYGFYVQ